MILTLFKKSYLIQIAFLIGFTLIIWLPGFIQPNTFPVSELSVYTYPVFSNPLINNPLISKILGFLLLLTEAFILSFLFSSHQLTHSNSFLSGFLFVLFLSRMPNHLYFHSALPAILFLLLGLKTLLENFKSYRSYNLILTSSLWFSLASLFIPSLVFLFPLIWIGLILFQSFNWRSIPISIIGFLIPYLLVFLTYFWLDKTPLFIQQTKGIISSLISPFSMPKSQGLIEFIISAILILIASSFILPRIGNQVISIRKKTTLMYWFLGISILISFYNTNNFTREIAYIPFAGLLGFYFSAVKRQFWADLFITLIFVYILIQNYQILFYA